VASDVEAYADAAPSLDATRVVDGSGVGLVRRCSGNAGSWEEACTLWEPGRAYEMTVRTRTYPMTLRAVLSAMRGRWEVEPVDAGARIVMTFDARPRLGPLGGLLLRLGRRRFDAECRAILDHWQQRLAARDLDTVTRS
jgi:hypothetical protein